MKASMRLLVLLAAFLSLVLLLAACGIPADTTTAPPDTTASTTASTTAATAATTTAVTTVAPVTPSPTATLGSISYNSGKTAISENDLITPELFSATCYYSDGTPAKVDVTYSGTLAAGETIHVRLSVTSVNDAEETKQVTIKNVRVYGAPTLSYDDTVTWINVSEGLRGETFSATATDTFGGAADITVSVEGACNAGTTVTVLITASDAVGNTKTARVENVKAYANPTLEYNTARSYVKLTDTMSAALFEAVATDSFGNPCTVEVTVATLRAGTEISINLRATDAVGNVTEKTVQGVKVYGTPTVEIDPYIYDDTDMDFVAVVYDSFGNELTPTVTYTGTLTDGARVTVTVSATDSVGNTVEKEYAYVVNHDRHTYADGYCTGCGQKDKGYIREGNYIYFGEYPQSLKAEGVSVTAEVDSRGYYLGSDGCYYARVTANHYGSGYTFSSGDTVTGGTVYYFKVEPIRWRILSEDGGTALILCDSIITNMAYDDMVYDAWGDNNYKNSDVRAWLNAQFYSTAFTDLQREIILTTTVDNSVASTGHSSNPYACEDTEDKVFLLSYAEATSSAYGFAASGSMYDTARRMQTSDYARVTGAWMSTSSDYYGNGYWWLRSPHYDVSFIVRYVNYDGYVSFQNVLGVSYGVVPALQIEL